MWPVLYTPCSSATVRTTQPSWLLGNSLMAETKHEKVQYNYLKVGKITDTWEHITVRS